MELSHEISVSKLPPWCVKAVLISQTENEIFVWLRCGASCFARSIAFGERPEAVTWNLFLDKPITWVPIPHDTSNKFKCWGQFDWIIGMEEIGSHSLTH